MDRSTRNRLAGLLSAGALVLSLTSALAAPPAGDCPDWRGVLRDGKAQDTGLLKEWPEGGPKQLWKATGIGPGFSSPIIAGGMIYITGNTGSDLYLHAFDTTGKKLWTKPIGPDFMQSHGGARATVTVSGSQLFVLSGMGRLVCFNARSGAEVWKREATEFNGTLPIWGYAETPLVLGQNVIFTPGGATAVVALNRQTGATVWTTRGFDAPAHYCSAITATLQGIPMIINGTGAGLIGISPKDGALLWQNDFCSGNTANIPTPAYVDGTIFWANGYRKGGICLKLTSTGGRITATEVWRTADMICQIGGYIVKDGYIYGNNGTKWTCLELATGKVMWSEPSVGKGAVCYADGMLYLFAERGGVAGLVSAIPDRFEQKGQFAVEGRAESWAYPVVAGGKLYLRYDDNLYCFDIKAR